jgi:NADH:ubiquinone oxidoreductase subunit E
VLNTTPPDRDLVALVDALVAEHGHDRAAVLPVLQGLRARRQLIDDAAMRLVADRLGTSPVAVQGVATFYAFVGTGRTGRQVIRVCRTLPCSMGGAGEAATALAKAADCHLDGTSADGAISLQWASCIGMCDQPPAILVDDHAVGGVTPDDARRVIDDLRAERAS